MLIRGLLRVAPRLQLTRLASTRPPASKALELANDDQRALEARKAKLYQMALKEYSSRNVPEIQEEVSRMLGDFPPAMHVFNIALKVYILLNDSNGIRDMIQRMTNSGFKPNTITYNLLISYYRNMGQMEDAMALFQRMKTMGIKTNASIYTTLIVGFTKSGNYTVAQALCQESTESAHVTPDLPYMNALITCYLAAGKPEQARAAASKMLEYDIKPNHVTYKVFLAELIEKRQIPEALRLYDQHLKDAEKMNMHDHSDIACRFLRAQEDAAGLDIFERTRKRYGACSGLSLTLAVDAYSKKGDEKRIAELWTVASKRAPLTVISSNAFLRHYLGRWEATAEPAYAREIRTIHEQALAANSTISFRINQRCMDAIATLQ